MLHKFFTDWADSIWNGNRDLFTRIILSSVLYGLGFLVLLVEIVGLLFVILVSPILITFLGGLCVFALNFLGGLCVFTLNFLGGLCVFALNFLGGLCVFALNFLGGLCVFALNLSKAFATAALCGVVEVGLAIFDGMLRVLDFTYNLLITNPLAAACFIGISVLCVVFGRNLVAALGASTSSDLEEGGLKRYKDKENSEEGERPMPESTHNLENNGASATKRPESRKMENEEENIESEEESNKSEEGERQGYLPSWTDQQQRDDDRRAEQGREETQRRSNSFADLRSLKSDKKKYELN